MQLERGKTSTEESVGNCDEGHPRATLRHGLRPSDPNGGRDSGGSNLGLIQYGSHMDAKARPRKLTNTFETHFYEKQ